MQAVGACFFLLYIYINAPTAVFCGCRRQRRFWPHTCYRAGAASFLPLLLYYFIRLTSRLTERAVYVESFEQLYFLVALLVVIERELIREKYYRSVEVIEREHAP